MGLNENLKDSSEEPLFPDELPNSVYDDVARLVPIFWHKRIAKLNYEILEKLAYFKLTKYDLVKKILAVNKLGVDGRYYYPTVKRRVDDLHSRGYLKVFGKRTAAKRGDEINLYGLSHKGRLVAALSSRSVSLDWNRMMENYLEDEEPFLQDLFKIFLNKNANIMSWMATADYECIFNLPNLDYFKGDQELVLVKHRIECIIDSLTQIYEEVAKKGKYPEYLAYVRDVKLTREQSERVIEALESPEIKNLVSNTVRTRIKRMEERIKTLQATLESIEKSQLR